MTSSPHLRFSPDGSKILLSISPPVAGGKKPLQEWWLIPFPEGRGRMPHRVLEALPVSKFAPLFSWMPDSRHVVVAINGLVASHLWMADTQSDDFELLTSGLGSEEGPQVSPDGQKVIFEDIHRDFNIEEVPLSGGAPQPLSSTHQWEFSPAWSPVAEQFAYVTNRNGPEEIWLRSVGEGWSRPLVTPGEFSDPTDGFSGRSILA